MDAAAVVGRTVALGTSALAPITDLGRTLHEVGFVPRTVVPPGWLHRLAVPLPAAKGSLKLLPCDLGWMATVWLTRARVNRTEQN
jgi:hypothetical protein